MTSIRFGSIPIGLSNPMQAKQGSQPQFGAGSDDFFTHGYGLDNARPQEIRRDPWAGIEAKRLREMLDALTTLLNQGEEGKSALIDLVQACRDENHQIGDNNRERLTDLNLLTVDGSVDPCFRTLHNQLFNQNNG